MTLTRHRKASLGVLAIAFAALAADRMFLGGGSPSAASAANTSPVVAGAEAVQAVSLPTGPGLATRLESIAAAEGLDPVLVEDVFAGEKEAVQLVVTATLGAGARASAMVNGEQLRIGQSFAGATLLGVTSEGAVFEREGERFFVPLPRPDPALQAPPRAARPGGA